MFHAALTVNDVEHAPLRAQFKLGVIRIPYAPSAHESQLMTNSVHEETQSAGPPNFFNVRPLLRAVPGIRRRGLFLAGIVIWALVSGPVGPFLRYPFQHPYVTFDRVWLIGIAASLFLVSSEINVSRTARRLTVAMGIFCAVYGFLSLLSAAEMRQLGPLRTWIDAIFLPTLLFMATARLVTTVEQARLVATAIAAGGVLISAIAIAEARFGFELATRVGSTPFIDTITGVVRVSGPYPTPDVLGLVLLVCLAMTLYWMQTQCRPWYLVGGAVALVECVAIGLTFFRSAWIGAILIVIAAFALRPGYGRRLVVTAAVAGVVLLIAFLALDQVPFLARRLTSDAAMANVYVRVAIDLQSLELFAQAPLTGVGVDQYTSAATHHASTTWAGVAALSSAHNSYMNVLAEQGLVGFLPFVAVTVLALRAIREVGRLGAKRDDILLGACAAGAGLAYLVMSLTLTMVTSGSSNAFLALLLGVVCGRLKAKAPETGPEALSVRGAAHGGP